MRHIFVINPLAGKRSGGKTLNDQILRAGERQRVPVEIYETRAAGDGENFVRETCGNKAEDEQIRFYACGGDGALNEVMNGSVGFPGVEVGCVPLGTGNDYVRNYGQLETFLDMEAQILGRAVDSDLISYRTWLDRKESRRRYCVNMFNIGFDCNVVDLTGRAKKWPLVSGSFAYLLSVAIILIKKKGANLRVCFEDGEVFDGRLLLIAIANGCFCGGGVKGVPLSLLDDGLMDVSLIRDVPRRTFVRLFPKYAKGTHLSDKKARDLFTYKKCERLFIFARGGPMRLCTDGEITDAEQVEFEIVPKGTRFSVPKGGKP